MDDISLLNFIAQEFQERPHWDEKDGAGHNSRFIVKLTFSNQLICFGSGKNKKEAKFEGAKRAIFLIAPKVYLNKYSDEDQAQFREMIEQENQKYASVFSSESLVQEELDVPEKDEIRLDHPLLPKLTTYHTPYNPYSFLKQAFCISIHKGDYTLFEHEQQNKYKNGPEDALKLHMTLKHQGQDKYSFECTGPSLKKGRHKLAIGILRQMYGDDKKWNELVTGMEQDIIEARDKRGAGPKPVV